MVPQFSSLTVFGMCDEAVSEGVTSMTTLWPNSVALGRPPSHVRADIETSV